MRLRLLALLIAGMTALPGVRAFQQTPPPAPPSGTVVLGRVAEDGKSTPVAAALVTVTRTTEPYHTQSALTDDEGRFVFFNLPVGSYSVRAGRQGYWGGEFGQLRWDGRSKRLVLENGQRIADAIVPIWRMAAVSGTVRDDLGEPVVGIIVQAFGLTAGGGRLLLSSAVRSVKTDDRGMYRLYALPPDDYVVGVPTSSLAALVSALPVTGDPAGDLT